MFLSDGTFISAFAAPHCGGLAEEEEELANLVECLDKASRACSMEITAKKTKLMSNNTSGTNTDRSLRQPQASSTWAQL